MAVVKISELPAMEEIAGTDLLPIVDASETETKKVTKQMLLTDIDGAEVKIGNLTEASTLGDNDLFLVNQSGTNKKVKKEKLQDKLVSGTNIKTINGTSMLGSGDVAVQPTLESGTNIKTINNTSVLGSGNIAISGTTPTGSIVMYGASTPPTGWLSCNGQAVSRTTYADLFAVIGTTYGIGDGSTTFNLPNFGGRVPVGYDTTQTEFNTMGKTGGAKTHTLSLQEMPNHTHIFNGGWGSGSINEKYAYGTVGTASNYGVGNVQSHNGTTSPHNNLQPYITLRYIIKA